MKHTIFLYLVALCLCAPAAAQTAYGPYKAELVEMTGDACDDLVLGYLGAGVVIVEQGDCSAGLSRIGTNAYVTPDAVGDRHVHNFAISDVDGDGKKDVAIAIGGLTPSVPGTIIVTRNMGGGTLTEQVRFSVPSQAKGVALRDFNGDDHIDLAATARGRSEAGDLAVGRLYIWPGLGGFSFGTPIYVETGRSSYDIELADLNGDGFADFLVPNERVATFHVVLNPGATLFSSPPIATAVTMPQAPGFAVNNINAVRAADFNGDGDLDVVAASHNSGLVGLWYGDGDGTFDQPTILLAGLNSAYMDVCDINADEVPDLAVTHYSGIQQTSVFINQGGAAGFFPRQVYATGLGSYGITCANYDGVGSPVDIITANYLSRSITFLRGIGGGTFNSPATIPRGIKWSGTAWVSE